MPNKPIYPVPFDIDSSDILISLAFTQNLSVSELSDLKRNLRLAFFVFEIAVTTISVDDLAVPL